jgi:hypothetical protein
MKDGKHMSDVVTREALEATLQATLQATQVIPGVPHPDPRMRPDELALRIPAAFWARLRRHIERSHGAQGSAAERTLWENWLTPAGVRAILAGNESSESDGALATALERLRATIVDSLQRPLSLRIDADPASRAGLATSEPTYLIVLSNGATVVLRVASRFAPFAAPTTNAGPATPISHDSHDSHNKSNPGPANPATSITPARLEDCFFTRAAADIARPAGDLAFPGRATGNPGGNPVEFAGNPADDSRLKAVVREWVGRYALVTGDGNLTGLVPPDRPCEFNRAVARDAVPNRVHFLAPSAWGFRGGSNGCRWEGFDTASPAVAYGSTQDPGAVDTVRQALDQQVAKRGTRREGKEVSGDTAADGGAVDPRLTLPRYRLTWLESLDETDVAETEAALLSGRDLSSEPSRSGTSRRSGGRETYRDSFANLPELDDAVGYCRLAWTGPAAAPAAYELALALGRCRLLNAEPACAKLSASSDFTLAPPVALAAARELSGRLERWGQRAEGLLDQLDGATPVRAADLCLGLLEARIEAWAAYVAIDEAYSAAVERAGGLDPDSDGSPAGFSGEIDALLDRMQAFDDALQEAEPLLATAAAAPGSRLLENWNALLAAPYRQSPPWWLEVALPHAALDVAAEEP